MAAKKNQKTPDVNTEAKIKAAARIVFHKKGFAAARTRDIAEESGINLALINYYFRSKEKLFEIIMFETITGFMQKIALVFNDENSTLEEKITLMAAEYIDLFTEEPEIPLFLMSEIRSHGAEVFEKLPLAHTVLHSVFMRQYAQAAKKQKATHPNPLHFLMNVMSMIVFPFIGSPMIKKVGKLNDAQFDKLMQERKKMIPIWVKAMLKTT